MKTFKVLQIDAWAENTTCDSCGQVLCEEGPCPDCQCEDSTISWTWNNWFHIEDFSGDLDTESHAFLLSKVLEPKEYRIDDDGYNLVLVDSRNGRPVLAIEYGGLI